MVHIPIDQPDASFGAIGSRYYGIYRMPGSSRWKQLHDGKRVLFFGTAHEASRAALAKVNSLLFRPIRAETEPEDEPLAEALSAAFLDFKAAQQRQSVEDRQVFRGIGKGSVQVITKRRRGA